MSFVWPVLRVLLAAVIIVAVGEVSKRTPRYGALLLSLPVVSMLAFLFTWFQNRDLATISKLARETLILVPLGLPFFVPFAVAERFGLGFWHCFMAGIVLAAASLGIWLGWTNP